VYFHYLSLRPDTEEQPSVSYVGDGENGMNIHMIQNKDMYCYLRDGEINMLWGWALVLPKYDTDVEDVELDGHNIKAKMSKSGLVLSVGEEPLLQQGVVEHINPTDFVLSRRNLSKGDTVLFLKNANFKNTIEDVEYYVMREWDIIAKKEDTCYKPLGDYVAIKELSEIKSSLITEGYLKEEMIRKGEVLDVGPDVEDVKVGDIVSYNSKTPFHIPYDGITYNRVQEIFIKHEAE
jgi:co-chaperonin GroES (HSP10)